MEQQMEVQLPFGPAIMIGKVPEDIFSLLQKYTDQVKGDGFNDYRDKLAGNIAEEYDLMTSMIKNNEFMPVSKYLLDLADGYIDFLVNTKRIIFNSEVDSVSQYNSGSRPMVLQSLWVNFQKKYEFNPLHNHTGMFSFVTYLKVPYKMEDEAKLPHQKGNSPNAGKITFQAGDYDYAPVSKEYIPEVQKIIFFPAQLKHYVYPFYTSDEERISISGNIIVDPRVDLKKK